MFHDHPRQRIQQYRQMRLAQLEGKCRYQNLYPYRRSQANYSRPFCQRWTYCPLSFGQALRSKSIYRIHHPRFHHQHRQSSRLHLIPNEVHFLHPRFRHESQGCCVTRKLIRRRSKRITLVLQSLKGLPYF